MDEKLNDLDDTNAFGTWAILELMGHVKLGGFVTEEERFGTKVGRIDVPGPNGMITTQYFGGSSLYRMTPCTAEVAKAYAVNNQPRPVHLFQLELPGTAVHGDLDDDDDSGW